MVVSLLAGMRGRFIFHQLTSIQLTQTDTQGMICTQRRNVEHLLGKTFFPTVWRIMLEIEGKMECKVKKNGLILEQNDESWYCSLCMGMPITKNLQC